MKPIFLADYSHHDQIYQALRLRGADGWSDSDEYAAMFELVVPHLPLAVHPPPLLLELGCGAGNFSLALASVGYDVVGVDISSTAVEWATERAHAVRARARFRVDNVVGLSTCSDSAFDAVVDGHCLHCVVGADRAVCLEAVWRVLRPGGRLVVLTMCGDVLNDRLLKSFDPLSKTVVVGGLPTRYIGGALDIIAEVERAGFIVEIANVKARTVDRDQDDLVIRASKI